MVVRFHQPVLLKEVVEALDVKNGWYIDATLGDGGTSLEIIIKGGKVLGIDVDPEALDRVKMRFKDEGVDQQRYRLVLGNFSNLNNLIKSQTDLKGIKFQGIIFDLGVSSLQLEAPLRGFSFMKEGPLDMRMDPLLQVSALDLINALNRKELDELFFKLGEERNARRLAEAVVSARQVTTITSTRQLAEIIERTLGRTGKIHPATKVFQALRIAVNDELNVLREALPQAYELIEKNGNILVISFHSLEDRIVKNIFKLWSDQGLGEVLTKKPLVPEEVEVGLNPRSRSAKLRVFKVL